MNRLIPVALIVILNSCGVQRVCPSVSETSVSKTVITERVVTVSGKAEFNVPLISETRKTRDTTITLENDFARATASVDSTGLSLSLETKPHPEYVPYEVQVPVHDTLVVEKEARTETKTVQVEKPLSWLQKTLIFLGLSLVALVVFRVTLWIFNKKRLQ